VELNVLNCEEASEIEQPYSGKICLALNLAKWQKKFVFWYWQNLNLAIWNCTC